jgi:hypothetical protein
MPLRRWEHVARIQTPIPGRDGVLWVVFRTVQLLHGLHESLELDGYKCDTLDAVLIESLN